MDIKLSFLGAAGNVTGSRYLVETDGFKVLVDCGLYQERQFQYRNWDEFPIAPSSIDAVLITHAHLDHVGWLPRLVKKGFSGKVYCTGATAELSKIVIRDSAKIQTEDAKYKKKRHKKQRRKPKYSYDPLYTIEDAEAAVPLFFPVRYETPITIGNGIEAAFFDAGHILGSSMIKLKFHVNGQKRSILFSGDVGRRDKPILNDPSVFEHADYVLIESTYGDRIHENTDNAKETFCKVINDAKKAGGNIIVPSFSIERAQEILYYLNELQMEKKIPHLMVFLDSPMAARATEVFEKHPEMFDEEMAAYIRNNNSPFDFPGLQITRTTSQSRAINQIRGTILVIAGSGMCTGGRVKHHLKNNISRPECTVLFAGYQAFGTIGRQIVDGAEEIRLMGQMTPVRANIVRAHGFSGHADRNELFAWLSNIKNPPKNIFVVHGEENSANQFAKYINQKTNWPTTVPNYQDQVTLT